jgi:hypothetical protein
MCPPRVVDLCVDAGGGLLGNDIGGQGHSSLVSPSLVDGDRDLYNITINNYRQ